MSALAALRHLEGVRRAWPTVEGTLTVELSDAEGLRAGRLDAAGNLWLTPARADKKLPSLTGLEGDLVVHRLHRRAVLLQGDRAVKALRPGRAAGVAAASRLMAEASGRAGIAAPEVLLATGDRVEFSLVAGRTLHELGDDGLDGWRELAERLPALARQDLDLPEHNSAAEIGVLATWLEHARRFGSLERLPDLGRAVSTVSTALAATPDPIVTLHRDLHDKQALWDGSTLSLLDLDTAARGEAALDLANLAVHAELRHMQGRLGDPDPVRDALEPAVRALEIREQRFAAYAQASRLRLAFLYSFRPSSLPWLDAWVEHTLTRK